MSLRRDFVAFDEQLASLGVPPCTAWWRDNIGAWLDVYERDQVVELWGCVGRGAAKSTALYKLALFFTLFGRFIVPPGERHFAIVLSRLKEEAAKGIKIISGWLRLLRVGFNLTGDVLEIDDLPRGIRVVAASVAATSGWRCYFVGKDERSKWPSDGVEEREAEEIDTSAAAMTATHPLAPVVSFGSAWGDFGAFYEAITAGSDAHRAIVGPAPTWVAAPHIQEASLRRKERDPRKFAREYECVFQSGFTEGYLSDVLDGCIDKDRKGPTGHADGVITIGLDTAFKWDECVAAVVRAGTTEKGAPFACVEAVHGWRKPANAASLSAEAIVSTIAKIARSHKARRVVGDQHHAESLRDLFMRHEIQYETFPWTVPSKEARFSRMRGIMGDRRLRLPDDPETLRQLRAIGVRLLPSGLETIDVRKGADDRAYAVCLGVTEALRLAPMARIRTDGDAPPAQATTQREGILWSEIFSLRRGTGSGAQNLF